MTEVFFSCEIPVYTFIKGFLSLTLHALYVVLTLFVCMSVVCSVSYGGASDVYGGGNPRL